MHAREVTSNRCAATGVRGRDQLFRIRPFAIASTWDHHHDDRNAVLFAAPPGAQEQLVDGAPHRYFRPPYVGGRGWVGMYLDDGPVDWDLVELHLGDAHDHLQG